MNVEEIVDVEEFKYCLSNAYKYFRINTLKISIREFERVSALSFSSTPIPFMKRLDQFIQLGSTVEYFLGLLHPQSLASSLASLALSPTEQDKVVDITASPGSKTTQLAMQMENKGAIVSNDRKSREKALLHNIARLGVLNVVVTSKDAKFPIAENYFDKALVDVPCSALGSHLNAWKRFEQGIAVSLSRVQKRMLLSAFDSIKQGGILVYSTCTITDEENEAVVKFLLENRNAKLLPISLQLPHSTGLSEYGREFRNVFRVYPQHLKSEGFFIAKIKKL